MYEMKLFLKLLATFAIVFSFICFVISEYALATFWFLIALELRIEYIVLLVDKDEK